MPRTSIRAMAFLRILKWLAVVLPVTAIGLWQLVLAGPHAPAWAPVDLAQRPGIGSVARIGGLAESPDRCRALLDRAGIAYVALPPRDGGANCGYRNGVRWAAGGAREAAYAPAMPPLACPLAAALAEWEWEVVQPAAARAFGTTVAGVDHFGSYACRRVYGRAAGDWSEHAAANAIDIAGFRLSDGRRVTVARDWRGSGAEARFLHAVRDGACRLFGTTLSPDYNEAHRDHLHLDEAPRGAFGFCR